MFTYLQFPQWIPVHAPTYAYEKQQKLLYIVVVQTW